MHLPHHEKAIIIKSKAMKFVGPIGLNFRYFIMYIAYYLFII